MPLFYFDVDSKSHIRDTKGSEFATEDDARRRALDLVAAFVASLDVRGDGGGISIRVKDEYQAVVSNVRLLCDLDQGQPETRIPMPGNDP